MDAVIEGSAFPAGDKVRITVQLLDARADRHLWSGSYERDLRDVLDLQREVAQAVAQEIRVTLTVRQKSRLTRPLSISPDAQEAYLKGRYHFNRRWEMKQALQCFQRAIELDPSYALAYAGVADCYRKLGENHIFPPAEALPRAKAAAIQALEVDEELVEAHVALGSALTNLDWDWHAAEREFRRALQLNPSHAEAHEEFAWYLSVMGRSQEAVAEADMALQLDPFSPLRRAHLGMALYFARRYDQAIEELRRSVDSLSESLHSAPIRSNFLAFAYAQTGRHEESIANLSKLRSAGNNSPDLLFSLGYAYAWSGKRIMAEEMILEIERAAQESYVLPYSLAMIYAGLRDWEKALNYLERAFKERVWVAALINSEPSFEPLRGNSRFQAVLQQMNFTNCSSPGRKDGQAVAAL
ncbi:MAG: tetratricopeptide repeat protein [Bryobacterales bacterium]|nr:tetratricopeptide repeat protein [Bryobacterales bacterium]